MRFVDEGFRRSCTRRVNALNAGGIHPRRRIASSNMFVLLMVLPTSLRAADLDACPRRMCLPPDDTQWPPLCHTVTDTVGTHRAESFAECPEEAKICEPCMSEPPCESHCSAQPVALKAPGERCSAHEECFGRFARCMQQRCKQALHTHQRCDAEDEHQLCIYGQKNCFRDRCQGLTTGDPCAPRDDGADIDCVPGWFCFLSVCTPQFPRGHRCQGQHPGECIRGHRCNLLLERPTCLRQYTLDNGELSSDPTLCKTNHVDPRTATCASVPPVEMHLGNPVVSGSDCTSDNECFRTDGSLGECTCKRWWDGLGTAGYCELFVQDSARPAYKQLWEASTRLCHHDWDDYRCAYEVGLEDAWLQVQQERGQSLSDPTEIESCAMSLLREQYLGQSMAPRGARPPIFGQVLFVTAAIAWALR